LGDGFVWSGNEAQAQLATVFDWKDAKTALTRLSQLGAKMSYFSGKIGCRGA